MPDSVGKFFDLRVSHKALSITRIAFFSIVFGEFFQAYLNRWAWFSAEDAWVAEGVLPLQLAVLVFVVIGYNTRFFLLLNFVGTSLVLHHINAHYHVDYVIQNAAFAFLFSPRPQRLAVDCVLRPVEGEQLVPASFVFLIFLGLWLVYFDSLFYKFNDPMWMSGLAFYLPAGVPHFSNGMFPQWMEVQWLMKLLSHSALVLETVFPLILLRWTRLPVALVGFLLHLGIAIFFPIPFFGLANCALYLMFICCRVKPDAISQAHGVSWTGRVTIAVGVMLIFLQGMMIYTDSQPAGGRFNGIFKHRPVQLISEFTGVERHGVYVAWHFLLHRQIVRFVAETEKGDVAIPSFNEQGYPDYPKVSGRMWVFLLFGSNLYSKNFELINRQLGDYLSSWIQALHIPTKRIRIYYRDVQTPVAWDFEIDDRVRASPWKLAGGAEVDESGRAKIGWSAEFVQRVQHGLADCCLK